MRVAIIGFGLAGEVFHAPLIAATDGLEVAVVVTGDAERAARARSRYPGVEVVADVDAVWAARPELVVVASPNRHHAEHARAAVEHGLPVVVDKPLAPGADEAAGVVAAAEERGVVLTVFQNRRWDGDFITARGLVQDGALGQVVRFESRFERFRPRVGDGWRELPGAAEGGGQLLDLGSHLVDQARVLFGQPRRVYAEVGTRRPGAEVDDDVFLALEHQGGVRSHLWMGSVAPLHGPRLAVSGLGGGFACDGVDPQERQLADGRRPGDTGFGERPPGRLVDAGGEREQPIAPGDYAGFYAELAAGRVPVDPHDSVAVLRVLEAARRSAESHTVIELDETPAAITPTLGDAR